MQGNYVAVYRLHGLGSLPESKDVELLSLSDPAATTVVLTTRPDDYCLHLDRQSAIGTTLLAVTFTNVQGDFPTVLAAQLKAAKEARDKHGTAVYLVVNSSGDLGEPNFSQRAERDEFIVCFDAFSKTVLRDKLRPLVNGVLAAVSLSMQDRYTHQITPVGDVTYAIDPTSQKPIYSFNPQGSATATLSGALDAQTLESMRGYVKPLIEDDQLEKIVRLLANSHQTKDRALQSFIEAWAALEIFINTSFKHRYEREWLAKLKTGTPASARPYFERLAEIMKDRVRLNDKFVIMASILNESGAEEDAATFARLKKIRDTFHTGEIVERNLPLQTAQLLLGKYLLLHVDYHMVESGGLSI